MKFIILVVLLPAYYCDQEIADGQEEIDKIKIREKQQHGRSHSEGSNYYFRQITHNQREAKETYSYATTKERLEHLTKFGTDGRISRNRHSSHFKEITYYHGSKYYKKSGSIVLTCTYLPKFKYHARYDNGDQVKEINFECNMDGEYCCELDCCKRMAWWITIAILLPSFALLIIVVMCANCCKKHYTR